MKTILNLTCVWKRLFLTKLYNDHHITNFVTIVLKRYIYSNKCRGLPVSKEHFVAILSKQIEIEFFAVKRDGSMSAHQRNWGPITGQFSAFTFAGKSGKTDIRKMKFIIWTCQVYHRIKGQVLFQMKKNCQHWHQWLFYVKKIPVTKCYPLLPLIPSQTLSFLS